MSAEPPPEAPGSPIPSPMASATLDSTEAPPATQDGQQNEEEEVNPEPQEAKMPTRKDISLKEFLGKMDDYAPIVSRIYSYLFSVFVLLTPAP